MIFTETRIPGVFIVQMEPRGDERGWFARGWCAAEFRAHGLDARLEQVNIARTERRGTIRGLHWQAEPHGEAKLVRCTRGAVWDVALDLRPASPTFGQWVGVELADDGRRMLYVPGGCAHGYQALADDTEVTYLVTAPYVPGAERGVRHDDPAFAIRWPLAAIHLSDKDRAWPDHAIPQGAA
jgi:dTDP-4-dehydrorhamnose 3,5-epimerase